jgi:hypothetical protein
MGETTMRIQKHKKAILGTSLALILVMSASLTYAQEFFPRKWNARKVNLSFNHYYDWEEMEQALRSLEKAYPKFLKLNTAGKSYLGRELWYMTINNPDTGDEMSKCAMYMDANIHGNEVQGGEIGLYTIWYLMENYNFNDGIKQLVDERVFYIFPSVNPDGRDMWLHKGASARTGQVPLDDDNDGLYDEDGAEDLDGDGEVGSMFIKVEPGKGTHRMADSGDRLVPIQKNIEGKPDEVGDYKYIGQEGVDNDGDGRYNEDQGGGYDANRDWGAWWQPRYIQRGAADYPFYWPESQATRDFFYAHPNIAGAQAFHNTGGMMLRGPGAELHGEYPASDLRVYDEIGQKGEKIIKGYEYMIIWDDLYPVWGGFIDFTHDMLGIFSFSNELWTSGSDLDGDGEITPEEDEFFNKFIDMDATSIRMHEIDHPELGKVIIDRDTTKLTRRVPPSWLIEEMCHRNMAFCLLHAYEMPHPIIKKVESEKIDGKLHRVVVTLYNERLMPTLSAAAATNQVQRPDILSLDGGIEVLAAGSSQAAGVPAGIPAQFMRFFRRGRGGGGGDDVTFIEQKDLKNLRLYNGIPGRGEVEYHFLVEGSGTVTVKLDCVKGGKDSKAVTLK